MQGFRLANSLCPGTIKMPKITGTEARKNVTIFNRWPTTYPVARASYLPLFKHNQSDQTAWQVLTEDLVILDIWSRWPASSCSDSGWPTVTVQLTSSCLNWYRAIQESEILSVGALSEGIRLWCSLQSLTSNGVLVTGNFVVKIIELIAW